MNAVIGDNDIAEPSYLGAANMRDNIESPLLLPSAHIALGDVGNHIDMAAGPALEALIGGVFIQGSSPRRFQLSDDCPGEEARLILILAVGMSFHFRNHPGPFGIGDVLFSSNKIMEVGCQIPPAFEASMIGYSFAAA